MVEKSNRWFVFSLLAPFEFNPNQHFKITLSRLLQIKIKCPFPSDCAHRSKGIKRFQSRWCSLRLYSVLWQSKRNGWLQVLEIRILGKSLSWKKIPYQVLKSYSPPQNASGKLLLWIRISRKLAEVHSTAVNHFLLTVASLRFHCLWSIGSTRDTEVIKYDTAFTDEELKC